MKITELKYRTTPIALATLFFSACALWIYFGPRTGGRIGQVLRNGDDLSVIGFVILAVSAIMAIVFLPHAVRGLLRLPAIENKGETLSIKMFPSKDIPLSEIENILIGKNEVKIITKKGYVRTINARLLKDHEDFFSGLLPEMRRGR